MQEPTTHDHDTAAGRDRPVWPQAQRAVLAAVKETGALASILQADQRRRWRKGQRAETETYLKDFPLLGPSSGHAADLVFHEFCLREEFGPPPQVDEFRRRFPQLLAQLEARLVVHQMLESEQVKGASLATPTHGEDSGDDEFPKVPRYDILRELGRGGMGVVYLAAQEGLDRFVALKMILPGAPVGPEDLLRFRVEAAAISRVQHPNLVQIYDVGEFQGLPYFSLEFVDGGSLEDKLEGKPLPPIEAARMTMALARAIHAAHKQGIIHRDLKPANVLLTSDGVPKITDFGIAKREDRGGKPKAEAILGTPVYMAPEQAKGKADQIGPHTDIYALGAMLYELLTGVPPFMGETVHDTLLMLITQDVTPPTRLQPAIPRTLEGIVMKCLEKEPAQRYSSGEALAEDLSRFLAREGDGPGRGVAGWLSRWIKGG